jgi:hypothetical protein
LCCCVRELPRRPFIRELRYAYIVTMLNERLPCFPINGALQDPVAERVVVQGVHISNGIVRGAQAVSTSKVNAPVGVCERKKERKKEKGARERGL